MLYLFVNRKSLKVYKIFESFCIVKTQLKILVQLTKIKILHLRESPCPLKVIHETPVSIPYDVTAVLVHSSVQRPQIRVYVVDPLRITETRLEGHSVLCHQGLGVPVV